MGGETARATSLGIGETPYASELLSDALPELDPAIRHLGAKALSFTLSAPSTAATPGSDDLPRFEVYIAAKYPGLTPASTADLITRFYELAEQHAASPSRASGHGRSAQL